MTRSGGVERRILDELLLYHAARADTPERELVAPRRIRQPVARRRVVQTAVVWAAILAVGVVLVVRVTSSGSSALAATPAPLHYTPPGPGAPSGSGLLRQLATTAAAQPSPTVPRQDRYAYVKTSGLVSGFRRRGGPGIGQVSPQISQSWTAPTRRDAQRFTSPAQAHTPRLTSSVPKMPRCRPCRPIRQFLPTSSPSGTRAATGA